MLKLVKKLERKQYLERNLEQVSNIQPPECVLLAQNSHFVNSGEYKRFDEALQKAKREQLRTPAQRPSIFSKSARGSQPGLLRSRTAGRPASAYRTSGMKTAQH